MIKKFNSEEEFSAEFYDTFPKTLYKYRTYNEFGRKAIENYEVYFANPGKDFNDPFDCNLRFKYEELSVGEMFNWALTVAKRRVPFIGLENCIKEAERLVNKRGFDKEYWKLQSIDQLKQIHKRYGIFCLTPYPENVLMWSHYANSHKGFCIGYDAKKLYLFFEGMLGVVDYSPEYPIFKPLEDVGEYYKQYMIKSDHWKYEDEYRIVKIGLSGKPIQIHPEIISEVIFGINMEQDHKTEILDLIKSDNDLKHVQVFQAYKDNNKFEIVLDQVML